MIRSIYIYTVLVCIPNSTLPTPEPCGVLLQLLLALHLLPHRRVVSRPLRAKRDTCRGPKTSENAGHRGTGFCVEGQRHSFPSFCRIQSISQCSLSIMPFHLFLVPNHAWVMNILRILFHLKTIDNRSTRQRALRLFFGPEMAD